MAAKSYYQSTVSRVKPGEEIQLESGTIQGSVSQYVLRTLPQDLLTVLRGVALQELNEQISAGNPPTQVLVDGRPVGRRHIIDATKSVSMRFMDTAMLVAAAREAYELLQKVTRIQSPPKNDIVARAHFYLWVNGKNRGLMPTALRNLDTKELNEKSVLRIVGPLVPYGRKLFWNPIGRNGRTIEATLTTYASGRTRLGYGSELSPRFKPYRKSTMRKIANRSPGDKAANLRSLMSKNPGYAEGMHTIVRRVLRKKRSFAGLHISDGWVSFPPARTWGKKSKDDRVPSVSVQLSKRGAVSIVNV